MTKNIVDTSPNTDLKNSKNTPVSEAGVADLNSVQDFLKYIGVRPERVERLESGEVKAVSTLFRGRELSELGVLRVTPSSWVLADSFDAVPRHTPDLDLTDPGLCHVLEFDACLDFDDEDGFSYRERAPFDEGAQRLECETCYGLEYMEERGCSAWYRKSRVNDPVGYEVLYEHLDRATVRCPSCAPERPEGEPVWKNLTWPEYFDLIEAAA